MAGRIFTFHRVKPFSLRASILLICVSWSAAAEKSLTEITLKFSADPEMHNFLLLKTNLHQKRLQLQNSAY